MRSSRSKESVCAIHSNALGDGGIVGCELFPKTTTAEAILAIMSIF